MLLLKNMFLTETGSLWQSQSVIQTFARKIKRLPMHGLDS